MINVREKVRDDLGEHIEGQVGDFVLDRLDDMLRNLLSAPIGQIWRPVELVVNSE